MPVGWMPENMICWVSPESSGVASFPAPAPWTLDVVLIASEEPPCRAAVSGELRGGRFRVMTVVLVKVVVVVITVSSPGRVVETAAAASVDAGLCSWLLGPFASSCQALRPALPLRYIVNCAI